MKFILKEQVWAPRRILALPNTNLLGDAAEECDCKGFAAPGWRAISLGSSAAPLSTLPEFFT
jgi:hypothetical protein